MMRRMLRNVFGQSFVKLVEKEIPRALGTEHELEFRFDRRIDLNKLARLFALVLGVARRHEATQIRIAPCGETGGTIYYTVGGQEQEMLALPDRIATDLIAAISKASKVTAVTQQGSIVLRTPSENLNLRVSVLDEGRHMLIVSTDATI